eukprot:5464483-Alexandrium_andersonii.AAC.1
MARTSHSWGSPRMAPSARSSRSATRASSAGSWRRPTSTRGRAAPRSLAQSGRPPSPLPGQPARKWASACRCRRSRSAGTPLVAGRKPSGGAGTRPSTT